MARLNGHPLRNKTAPGAGVDVAARVEIELV